VLPDLLGALAIHPSLCGLPALGEQLCALIQQCLLLGTADRLGSPALGQRGLASAQPGSASCSQLTGLPASQVVYYVFAIIGINLFRGVIVPPGNSR
jgi:hypothetical protein